MKLTVVITLLFFVVGSFGELDSDRLPQNSAVRIGVDAILRCAVADPNSAHSIQWTEFISNPTGAPISDNLIIGNHPNADRYEILHRDAAEYSLVIRDVRLSDGGIYLCQDAQASPIDKRQHGCSLTVIQEPTNCTTTIGASSIVLDLSYQTNDCITFYQGAIVPNMTWSGIGPFQQAYGASDNLVWAGMQFNVTRDMDTRAHQATTFFTGYFLPVDGNSADNVPDYTFVHQSRQMFVYWGPTNLTVAGQKPVYEAGDAITCTSDAWPPASYLWQNMRTNQIYSGQTLRIDEGWVGFNQSLRCEARNEIEGTIYSNFILVPADVPTPTTPTTPTTTPTTTPPPAVAPCPDPTGAWVSVSPTPGSLCLRVNFTAFGGLTGLLKNATDSYWVDIVGRTQVNKYDQLGFNGIWPGTIGVSSFVGECHRCFGVENLLINVVTRRKGSPCGIEGLTQFTTQYHFFRSTSLTCPNIPSS